MRQNPDGSFSSPTWPKPYTGADRTLFYLHTDGRLYAEPAAGMAPCVPHTFDDVQAALFLHNGICWTGQTLMVALHPWLGEIMALCQAAQPPRPPRTLWAEWRLGQDGSNPIMLSVHSGAKQRHIAHIGAWIDESRIPETPEDIAALLARLRWLFDALASGVHPTPGAAGEASMRREWQEHKDWPHRHRPARRVIAALERHGVGGRIELLSQKRIFAAAWEQDIHAAYLSMAGQVPDAPSVGTIPESGLWAKGDSPAWRMLMPLDAPALECATWFCRCAVRIEGGAPEGMRYPFAIRQPSADTPGGLTWPTKPGIYDCWLWREEAEAIEELHRAGYPIELAAIDGGYYWRTFSTQLAGWAERLDGLRTAAHATQGKELAGLVKLCGVAGIGRLAMSYSQRVLVPEERAGPRDIPWTPAGFPHTVWCVRTEDQDRGTPAHWAVYIWMRCNVKLWRNWFAGWQAGKEAIAFHVDATIWADKPEPGTWQHAPAVGECDLELHSPLVALAPGWLLSPQKLRTAGMPADTRERLMRLGEQEPAELTGRGRDRRAARNAMRAAFIASCERLEMARAAARAQLERQRERKESG